MPQLKTEDMCFLGLRSKFQNVCAYTQTLIHSFIQKQSQRKYHVRIMNKGHTYVAAVQINFQKVLSTLLSKQPWFREGNTKKRIFHLEIFLSP